MIASIWNRLRKFVPTVLLGATCGLIYQIYKHDMGFDGFLNIRLPMLVLAGIFFAPLIRYVDSRLMSVFAGRYDAEIDRENVKTYLPFLLLLFYPIQKLTTGSIWQRSLFLHFSAIALITVLLLKAILVIRSRKLTGAPSKRHFSVGLLPGVVGLGLGLFFFLCHQVSMVFANYSVVSGEKAPESAYVFDNYETRKAYTPPVDISETVPFDRSGVTIAYKILKLSPEILEAASTVPFLFHLRVSDRSGDILVEEEHMVDALQADAAKWAEIKFTVPKHRTQEIHMKMTARPMILRIGPRFFMNLISHNPLNFAYLRALNVRAVWSEPEIVASERDLPDVFLISIDTLRSDRLGCYGYPGDISPAVDSLAEDGIQYLNAFSQSTWTLPSHLSLLTSRFPNELTGVREINVPKHVHGRPQILEKPNMFFSEVFKKNGYYSAAFTDGGFVSSYYGFYRGFHLYNEQYGEASNSFRLAALWLSQNKDKDVFVFVHTYLVHGYLDEVDIASDREKLMKGGTEDVSDPSVFNPATYKRFSHPYDKRVRLVDDYIREFLTFLKRNEMYDNSLIIFTSDHGESFGETHNDGKTEISLHAKKPYESQIRVPLIIKPPRGRFDSVPRVISNDVQLIDVGPTILAMLGMSVPAEFQGHPSAPFDGAEMERAPESVYALAHDPATGCIRRNHKKYIYDAANGAEEFYDLKDDPLETRNLAGSNPPEMPALRETYRTFQNRAEKHGISLNDAADVDSEDLHNQLKALGYLN